MQHLLVTNAASVSTLPFQRSRPNGPRTFLLPNVIPGCVLLQRLPQPAPRPRLPVRVASQKVGRVKAAQVDVGKAGGRVHRSEAESLDRPATLEQPHGRQRSLAADPASTPATQAPKANVTVHCPVAQETFNA
jgi:hypothetical protein